ncbi:MAG: GNAT family N-acetyltransferase [Bacteroidaceae bacterium]|nr:GNAT family N-acetyltransferase [Bacteroidaceae bacterium]
MLYELAHAIQAKIPWIWEGVEAINAALCGLKIADRRKLQECLPANVRIAGLCDAGRLADFFARQPKGSFKWFRPHAFDEATMRKLLSRKSYIIYVQEEDEEIIGYAFLRCFVNGKCFLGKMVDVNHQGKGVCTRLCATGMTLAEKVGFRMFESINKDNLGSMKASQKACDVIVMEALEGGDLLIEDRPKGSLAKK